VLDANSSYVGVIDMKKLLAGTRDASGHATTDTSSVTYVAL
jgi:hypothetical protein